MRDRIDPKHAVLPLVAPKDPTEFAPIHILAKLDQQRQTLMSEYRWETSEKKRAALLHTIDMLDRFFNWIIKVGQLNYPEYSGAKAVVAFEQERATNRKRLAVRRSAPKIYESPIAITRTRSAP